SSNQWISDRTTIDNAAYWLTWCHSNATPEERRRYMRLAKMNALESYDLVVYVPVEFPPEHDGFRIASPEYQQEIDDLVMLLLRGWEIPYLTVYGSVEARVSRVLGFLEVDAFLAHHEGM